MHALIIALIDLLCKEHVTLKVYFVANNLDPLLHLPWPNADLFLEEQVPGHLTKRGGKYTMQCTMHYALCTQQTITMAPFENLDAFHERG